jgi:hypothetical protein
VIIDFYTVIVRPPVHIGRKVTKEFASLADARAFANRKAQYLADGAIELHCGIRGEEVQAPIRTVWRKAGQTVEVKSYPRPEL